LSACKLHSTEEAVLGTRPFGGGCPGAGRRQSAQCAGVGWLVGLGRLAIGRRVRVSALGLERGRVVLKVRSLRQEHTYL
jgi:hypothetical protein